MRYKFYLTNRKWEEGSFICNLESDGVARLTAASIIHGVAFIESVEIYRILTDNSDGLKAYVGTCDRKNL